MINFIINCTKSFTLKLMVLMSTIILVVAFMITHNFHVGYNMTSKYIPLIDAATEIKLEVTTAHLWLEEIVSGDRNEDINKIIEGIEGAIWYTSAIMHGGTNHKGTFLPIENKKIEYKLESILNKLQKIQKITELRYKNLGNSYAGSEMDKEYDAMFKSIIVEASSVENTLQSIIFSELKTYKITYYITLVALFIFLFIVSLILTRYEKRLQEMSITDPLTKLYNRLYMENIFETELHRAKRYQQVFSIIFVDIDHFKKVNDEFGHDVGDVVLIEIANILKSNSRALDTVARWGGEEFIILCPETDMKSAETLAQKLRQAVESHKMQHVVGNNEPIIVGHKTCSFGVSQYTEEDNSVKHIIKRADNALYEAKNNGRNQVVTK